MQHILALLLFPLVGFAWSVAYVLLLGRVLARSDPALAAALVAFPIFTLVCGVLWLAVVWLWETVKGRAAGVGTQLALAVGTALAFGLILSGPRGFTLAPGSELVNVHLLLAVSSAAFLHAKVISRLDARREASDQPQSWR